ncbi:MAG: hypothetical protein R3A52_08790 [Polyangiales bacterium]
MLRKTLPFFLLAACGSSGATPTADAGAPDAATDVPVAVDVTRPPDRAVGVRAPRTARCDASDDLRCLLPWPSNTYARTDSATPTGLRLAVQTEGLAQGDDPAALNRADGFSRATPIIAGFRSEVDEATVGDGTTGAVRVIQASGEGVGALVPLRFVVMPAADPRDPEAAVVAYPRVLLKPATDYVVVVTDALRTTAGGPAISDDAAAASLGLRAPRTQEEAELAAYHAPSLAAVRAAGVDPARVLRVWDFTTRSADDPRGPLRAMIAASRAALRSGSARVEVAGVDVAEGGTGLATVRGFVRGLPRWTASDGFIHRDASGAPVLVQGETYSAPFRVRLPRGEGGYRIVAYGHGTGGDVDDSAFDETITGSGAAKVSTRFDGLTGADLVDTFSRFTRAVVGVDRAVSSLLQAASGTAAMLASARSEDGGGALPAEADLGAALAADTLMGMPNPAAGRRPQPDHMVWVGGSLGATMGLTLARAVPNFSGAVLNVPGAAWTHFLTASNIFGALRPSLRVVYGSDIDVAINIAATQGIWDEVDGSGWADLPGSDAPLLLQESIGDPVLPNIGAEFAAAAVGAAQVGAVIVPVVGAPAVASVDGGNALTQFRVPASVTGALNIHGFAAGDSIAGVAAREQIEAFVRSVWAGAPRVEVPPTCRANTPANSCDFSARQ